MLRMAKSTNHALCSFIQGILNPLDEIRQFMAMPGALALVKNIETAAKTQGSDMHISEAMKQVHAHMMRYCSSRFFILWRMPRLLRQGSFPF